MGYVLTASSIIKCPHGGEVRHSSTNMANVQPIIDGSIICRVTDRYTISGCSLWVDFRCEKVEWHSNSNCHVENSPILTNKSLGFVYSSGYVLLGLAEINSHQKDYSVDEGD